MGKRAENPEFSCHFCCSIRCEVNLLDLSCMEAVLVIYQQKGWCCSCDTAGGSGSRVLFQFWWEFCGAFLTEKRNNQAVSEPHLCSVNPRAASIASMGETGNKGSWLCVVALPWITSWCAPAPFFWSAILCSSHGLKMTCRRAFNRTINFLKPDSFELGCKELLPPTHVHTTKCSLLKQGSSVATSSWCRTLFHVWPMFCFFLILNVKCAINYVQLSTGPCPILIFWAALKINSFHNVRVASSMNLTAPFVTFCFLLFCGHLYPLLVERDKKCHQNCLFRVLCRPEVGSSESCSVSTGM